MFFICKQKLSRVNQTVCRADENNFLDVCWDPQRAEIELMRQSVNLKEVPTFHYQAATEEDRINKQYG